MTLTSCAFVTVSLPTACTSPEVLLHSSMFTPGASMVKVTLILPVDFRVLVTPS